MKHPASATLLAVLALAGCSQTTDPTPTASSSSVTTPTSGPTSAADSPPAFTGTPTPNPPPIAAGEPTGPVTGWPQTVTIPKLGVTAPIVGPCTINPDGSIEPPADIHATCATERPDLDPTGTGTTTLTGHTTRDTRDGALEHISELTPGDTITVANHTWTVTQTGTWPATALPPDLFTQDGPRRLILGTCHQDAAVKAGAPYTQTDLAVAIP